MGIWSSFAALLEYPAADLPCCLDRCLAEVVESKPAEAADSFTVAGTIAALLRFREEIRQLGLTRLEESYTAAFDMDPGCALYAGHHLFGETEHRGAFMACLADIYHIAGFTTPVGDLPDYLPTMLRFVDRLPAADEDRVTLLDEAVLPAARAIAEALERRNDPYIHAMRALLAVLEPGNPATAACVEGATS